MSDAALAGVLLAIDPAGLGGAILRGPSGPDRDAWLGSLRGLLPPGTPVRRLPPRIDDDRLLGGLDLSASLAAGRSVLQRGVLAEADGGIVVVPMAERLDQALTARLCGVLDTLEVRLERDGITDRALARIAVIALDEGMDDDEAAPGPLADRLAFHLDVAAGEADAAATPGETAAARTRLAGMGPPDPDLVEALCATAIQIGVASLRAPVFALKAATAHAALKGRATPDVEDAAVAARLVLAPRATRRPSDPAQATEASEPPPPPPPESPPSEDGAPEDEAGPASDASPSDVVIAAALAALPAGLLEGASASAPASGAARSGGAGAQGRSAARGRPAGVRPGALGAGARLNLVETLRAAAPWQALRRQGAPAGAIKVLASDFRIQKFVQRRESTTIFAVDASGSTALQRLAEAKGAVELLLAKAYVSRARVALIAFRGLEADLMLPPTRSLARARARLAGLPGGGGTPLASAMDAALAVALGERKRGATPQIVLLTDGRANIARGGVAGRAAAEADARAAARAIGEARIASVFVDTAPRPGPDAGRFARDMGASYCHLPYVDARALADAVEPPRERRR